MNNIFKKIAGDANLSYAKIIKIIRQDGETESETYSGTPEQLERFAELVINECARLARLHTSNDSSLTIEESRMSISTFIKSKFK